MTGREPWLSSVCGGNVRPRGDLNRWDSALSLCSFSVFMAVAALSLCARSALIVVLAESISLPDGTHSSGNMKVNLLELIVAFEVHFPRNS